MPKTIKTPQEKRDDAKAKWETLVYTKRLKKSKGTQSKYDAVDNNNTSKRRSPVIEMQDENKILRDYDRLRMINLCRDLERNSTSAKSILKQFKVNVVGSLAKLQFNSDNDETNKIVNGWFNKRWSPKCDSRSDLHFSEQLKLMLASIIREGDCVVAFDNFDRNDGKLVYWEADQLVEIDETEWKNQTLWVEDEKVDGKVVPLQQSSGVIFDSKGRVRAYAVSSKRGMTTVKLQEATILPYGIAKLIKDPFRLNQLRGTGDFFAAISDIEDIYEMRAKELQCAKLAGTFGGTITKSDGVDEAILRGGVAPESLLDTDEQDPATTEVVNYENLETLTGGAIEYLLEGEEFKGIDFNRPNMDVQHFYDMVLQSSGAGFGLAKAYTKMEAYNSYTAFRGEMLLTWATFYEWQKFLERHVCDWVAIEAIKWAKSNGQLKVDLPEGWEYMISWTFPVMPQVDPEKDNRARRESMKDGFTDFSDVLGPDWKQKLTSVSEGLQFARDMGIPLTAFESQSGQPLNSLEKKSDGKPDANEEEIKENDNEN